MISFVSGTILFGMSSLLISMTTWYPLSEKMSINIANARWSSNMESSELIDARPDIACCITIGINFDSITWMTFLNKSV